MHYDLNLPTSSWATLKWKESKDTVSKGVAWGWKWQGSNHIFYKPFLKTTSNINSLATSTCCRPLVHFQTLLGILEPDTESLEERTFTTLWCYPRGSSCKDRGWPYVHDKHILSSSLLISFSSRLFPTQEGFILCCPILHHQSSPTS